MRKLLALGAVLALTVAACGGGNDDPGGSAATTVGDGTVSLHEGPPPWPLGGDQAARMRAAGVPLLKAEGSVVHYHAHLDVFYDGQRVAVPANIGVDFEEEVISPLHTHYPSGVIHVEANKAEDFTLGQFLTEWGVKNGGGCIADKCGDEVAVFVDGSIQDVNAADLVIKAETQIALVLGTEPPDIPSDYDCKAEAPSDLCPEAES